MTLNEENGDTPVGERLLGTTWFGLHDVFRDTDAAACRLIYEAAPAYVLIAAARRHGSIVMDGVPYPFPPYAIRLALPGQRVETVYEADGEQLLYRFHFDIVFPEGGGAPAELPFKEDGGLLAGASVQPLFEKIVDHWHTGDEADRFASQAGFQDLLHLLFKREGQNEDVLEKAFEYMKLRFRESVSVENLAEEAGMSRYYFMRSFKDRFGQSAMDCLAELRMNEAKRLLEAGQSVRDAAYAAGYKDPLYFSSQFKKQVGFSPRIYAANRKCRTAAYSWPNLGHLLSLQIVPCAAPIDQPWTDDYRRKYRFDIEVPLSHDYEFNRKALKRVRPDRIVALSEMIPEEEKEELRRIAPVLFLNWHRDDWRAHLRQTAGFLEREKEGEQWLARYDGKAEAVRRNVPASFRQGEWLVLTISPLGIQIWGKRAGTVLYDDLGFRSARGAEQIEFTEFVKVERLAAFDADALLVSVMRDRQSQAEWERLERSACWKKLKAVRNRNVCMTSGDSWLREPILEYTAYRQELLLQELDLLFRAR